MAFFTTFFKQAFSKKARKNSSMASCKVGSSNKKIKGTSSFSSRANSTMETNSINSLRQESTKDGHSFKYNEEGRRYHGNDEVAYILPNDDDEADRVHQQHWILRYVFQSNFHAPVTKMLEEGIMVLDSGCGPATWTFEMAEQHPRSQFHGVDVSCVFPENIKPANVEFVIGNIAKHIPYPDNTFDYIHQRLLIFGLTNEDWENALKELFRVLKPGGWIELAEADLQELVNMGPLLKRLQDTTSEMLCSRGMPKKVAAQLEDFVVNAGFVNQTMKVHPLPLLHDGGLGDNGKLGRLIWDDYRHVYTNFRPAMAKVHPQWEDPKAYQDYLQECGLEAKQNKASLNWAVCYAQKPPLA